MNEKGKGLGDEANCRRGEVESERTPIRKFGSNSVSPNQGRERNIHKMEKRKKSTLSTQKYLKHMER